MSQAKLIDQVRAVIRLKHHSHRSEEAEASGFAEETSYEKAAAGPGIPLATLKERVSVLGTEVRRPWRAGEKAATVAAWVTLSNYYSVSLARFPALVARLPFKFLRPPSQASNGTRNQLTQRETSSENRETSNDYP